MIDFLSWICDLVFGAVAWLFPGTDSGWFAR
jgi:hypothetical protein